MSQNLEDALVTAFPAIAIDRMTIDEPTANWSVYDDISSISELAELEGKTWQEVPADFLERHTGLPVFAGDSLFCTMLPAYLRYLMQARERFNDLPFQVAGQLTRRTDVDNDKLDRRRSKLSTAQRAVVGKVLDHLATVPPMDEVMARAASSWNTEEK